MFYFSECSSLKSIEIPSSVTSIGANAFAYCSSLKSIKIPSSVKSIGDNVFSCCALESIEIPFPIDLQKIGIFSKIEVKINDA